MTYAKLYFELREWIEKADYDVFNMDIGTLMDLLEDVLYASQEIFDNEKIDWDLLCDKYRTTHLLFEEKNYSNKKHLPFLDRIKYGKKISNRKIKRNIKKIKKEKRYEK